MTVIPRRRRLTAIGTALAFSATAALTAVAATSAHAADPIPLVSSGDTEWRYLDDNTDPAAGTDARTSWTTTDFDDAAWQTGTGSFGALRGELAPLNGGFLPDVLLNQYIDGDGAPNVPAFFFRTEVELSAADLDQDLDLRGSVRYDDAATVYVNGTRVAGFHDEAITENMQYGGSNQSTPNLGEIAVPSDVLTEGSNVIAVEIHQGRETSSDVYFDMPSLQLEPTPPPSGPSSVLLGVGTDETERNLSWFSDTGQAEVVQIAPSAGLVDGGLPETATTIEATETGPSLDGINAYSHATLSNLEPETAYTYRVGSETGWSDLRTFSTHGTDLEHEFTLMGDPQVGSSGNVVRDGEGWAAALTAADELYPDSQFVLSAGDQVENAGSVEQYRTFLAPEQMSTQATAMTLGNHDIGSPLFGQHFNLPNVTEADSAGGSYWFKHNGVLHLNINSNSNDFAAHERFLREAIEAEGDDAAWTVLTFHHGLFSVGPHSISGSVAKREGLAPIISSLDIDLVLAGHDHSYARSHLMDGTTPIVGETEANDDGVEVLRPEDGEVLYITANSSSGSKYYSIANPLASYASVIDQSRTPTVASVEVEQCSITTTSQRTDNDEVIDAVELFKDEGAPALTLPESDEVTVNDDFDPMSGVGIDDACDPALTAEDVTVDGEVDTGTAGTYSLTYAVTDASGNQVEAERTVVVVEGSDDDSGSPQDPDPDPGTPGDASPTDGSSQDSTGAVDGVGGSATQAGVDRVLPATGAQITKMLVSLGALLLLAGAVTVVLARRRTA
ncbi:fibronectin type III domain-containing protein [Aeromicrobium sp. CF4.19]|uniref:fibronectin type III domain-containing protein n=1 Tax=Aeromicrobium sp. CF4.19 TaxID=3373082 RepID=UPI003EE61EFD